MGVALQDLVHFKVEMQRPVAERANGRIVVEDVHQIAARELLGAVDVGVKEKHVQGVV